MTFKKAIWTFGLQHFVHQCTTCAKYEKPFQMRVQTGRECSGMVVTILFKFQSNDRVANQFNIVRVLIVALIEIINYERRKPSVQDSTFTMYQRQTPKEMENEDLVSCF